MMSKSFGLPTFSLLRLLWIDEVFGLPTSCRRNLWAWTMVTSVLKNSESVKLLETWHMPRQVFCSWSSNYQAPIFAEIAYCNVQSDKKESMKSAVSEIAHVANHLNDELNRAYAQLNSFKTWFSSILPCSSQSTRMHRWLILLENAGVGNDMYFT